MKNKRGLIFSNGRNMLVLLVVSLIFTIFVIETNEANAANSLVLSTRYPGISAAKGEKITFPLQIKNNSNTGQIVNVKVYSHPENWHVSLRGSGRFIHQVFVDSMDYTSFDLVVNIPNDVEPGKYSLQVVAQSENGSGKDNLKININIAEGGAGNEELVAKYSELKGSSDATFKFKIDLTNNGNTEQVYSLGAQAEEGWQVSFKPSYENQEVASIGVGPGDTVSLEVTVKPPVNVKAGTYTIPVQAVSSASRVTEELKIIISGTYKMEFSTPSGKLNTDIVAGREKKVNLEVKNTGSAELNNINFSSSQPIDWSVTFEPESIPNLKPGESRQVTATIVAANKAIAGDYLVSLEAATQEVRSSADLRVTVKTSTLWGIIGFLIILAVIFAIYKAFQVFGRR